MQPSYFLLESHEEWPDLVLAGVGGCHSVPAELEGYRDLRGGDQPRVGPRVPLRVPDDAPVHRPEGGGGEDVTTQLHV